MTKTPHNTGQGDHDRNRNHLQLTAEGRDLKRRKLLIESLLSWAKGDRKGTRPRKYRIGQSTARSIQTRTRARKDRVKRRMQKQIQRTRLARNQNVRSGQR